MGKRVGSRGAVLLATMWGQCCWWAFHGRSTVASVSARAILGRNGGPKRGVWFSLKGRRWWVLFG